MSIISPAQLAANQANALLSTGPRTSEGKAKSSLNAVRTGLTGRAILLSASEADAYELHCTRFACDFNPVGDRETELVQSLADTQWRLNRVPVLEAGIYAMRRLEYADLFAEESDENVRELLVQTYIWETHRQVFNNLGLQESRLRRNYAKDLAELTLLQQYRGEQEQVHSQQLTSIPTRAIGFEFSSRSEALSQTAKSASKTPAAAPVHAPPRAA